MKKAFTLIEVLISISLLSIVIVTVLHVKQNNLFYIEKFKNSAKNNIYIALASAKKFKNSIKDEKIYLDEIVRFKDDDIRKELKDIKVYLKEEKLKKIDLSSPVYSLKIQVISKNYSLDEKANRSLYTFRLE